MPNNAFTMSRLRQLFGGQNVGIKAQAGTPVAADFGNVPSGTVGGPIYCTGDNKLYFLMTDGTTIKKTVAVS